MGCLKRETPLGHSTVFTILMYTYVLRIHRTGREDLFPES